jgi:hypothetical protein
MWADRQNCAALSLWMSSSLGINCAQQKEFGKLSQHCYSGFNEDQKSICSGLQAANARIAVEIERGRP